MVVVMIHKRDLVDRHPWLLWLLRAPVDERRRMMTDLRLCLATLEVSVQLEHVPHEGGPRLPAPDWPPELR